MSVWIVIGCNQKSGVLERGRESTLLWLSVVLACSELTFWGVIMAFPTFYKFIICNIMEHCNKLQIAPNRAQFPKSQISGREKVCLDARLNLYAAWYWNSAISASSVLSKAFVLLHLSICVDIFVYNSLRPGVWMASVLSLHCIFFFFPQPIFFSTVKPKHFWFSFLHTEDFCLVLVSFVLLGKTIKISRSRLIYLAHVRAGLVIKSAVPASL